MIKSVSYITHKGIGMLNEDALLVDEEWGLFGIFDGATSLTPYLLDDSMTGGYVASHIASDVFSRTDGDLAKTALKANAAIEAAHISADIDVSTPLNRFSTTATVVKVDSNSAKLLQIADSIILMIYAEDHVEVSLGFSDIEVEIMRKWRDLVSEGKTNIRQLVSADIIKLRLQANKTHGVLNGDSNVSKFILRKSVPLEGVASILLFSDGMFIPKEDPDADENWQEFAKIYLEGGLNAIYTTVRAMEDSDPDATRYPRFKRHDDATAITLDFEIT